MNEKANEWMKNWMINPPRIQVLLWWSRKCAGHCGFLTLCDSWKSNNIGNLKIFQQLLYFWPKIKLNGIQAKKNRVDLLKNQNKNRESKNILYFRTKPIKLDTCKVIMQGKLIAVAYTLRTCWNQFSLGVICKQK